MKPSDLLAFVVSRSLIWLALALALFSAGALAQEYYTCEQLEIYIADGVPLFDDERIWYDRNCVEEEDDDDDDDEEDLRDFVAMQVVSAQEVSAPRATCATLPPSILVSGYGYNTHCQRLDAGGVGIPDVIAQGILDAVDIYGALPADARVCFLRLGRLVFLDAATAPRTVSELTVERIDGMTCGRAQRPGTVVLLQGNPTNVVVADSPPPGAASEGPPPPAAQTGPSATTSCQVETTGYLSLRAGPSVYYTRFLAMPRGTRLVAKAKIGDWFMVEYAGQVGWASGTYLAASPVCAGLGDEGAIILPPAVEQPASEVEAPEAASESAQPRTTEQGEQSLTSCQLRTGDILNLRERPGLDNPILAEIPIQTVLAALERAGDWFKVEYLEQMGWVNIGFVFRSGACG
ncbi:MAG: hypothetical protein OXG85_05285 [Chloroflexi bacterium]|nr:hypothetical protein [Chloroflexota bacterium]